MVDIGLKMPKFLNLDEAAQKRIIEDVTNSSMLEHEKQATIESMIFLKKLKEKLKKDPHITLKQVKKLFEAHSEQIKKMLLAQ